MYTGQKKACLVFHTHLLLIFLLIRSCEFQEHDLDKHLKENILTFLEENSWVWEFFYVWSLLAKCLFKSHTKKPAREVDYRYLQKMSPVRILHSPVATHCSGTDEYCFLLYTSLVTGYICICINCRHWTTVSPHVSYFSPFGLVLFAKTGNTWGELVKRKPEESTQKCHMSLCLCKQTHKASDSGKSE